MGTANPLTPGSVLEERFEIDEIVGRGGFSFVYGAVDLLRDDHVIVKELAPEEARRDAGELMDLGQDSHLLRRKFLEEAAIQGRLNVSGLVPVRTWFSANGTAYIVSDRLPDSETLDELIRRVGPLELEGALDIFYQLLEIVETIHRKGVLHRDIKPTNVLVSKAGVAHLIDFGAAREWKADGTQTHTVMYTPGYAPPEQLSEKARRGPATDVYALGATLYHMLAGHAPPTCTDRMSGTPLDMPVGPPVQAALEAALKLPMLERPQSVSELRDLLDQKDAKTPVQTLEELDDLLYNSKHFLVKRRGCPACDGVLVQVKPLRTGVCPVCHEGFIRKREIHERLCPVCKIGTLMRRTNTPQPFICPNCLEGVLSFHRAGLLKKELSAECPECGARGSFSADGYKQTGPPSDSWRPAFRKLKKRSEVLWWCDSCSAQFDEQNDGRWTQMVPPPGEYVSLHPEEWARVACGCHPTCGNAECAACFADFYREGNSITLLEAKHDPHDYAADYSGRRIKLEDARWLAVGKTSPHPGLVCEDCHTEFDQAGSALRLIQTKNRSLGRLVDQVRSLEDWQRIGAGLPTAEKQSDLQDALVDALHQAYLEGQIGFDGRKEIAWKGPAKRLDSDQEGALTINAHEISFGGLIRRLRLGLEEVEGTSADGNELFLRTSEETIAFDLTPVDLTAHLKSGPVTVSLRAEDLRTRIGTTSPTASPR